MWERLGHMMAIQERPVTDLQPLSSEIADAELREALRLARGACELLDHAAPMSGPRGHSVRIAQAISESLVKELEVVTGVVRAKRLA